MRTLTWRAAIFLSITLHFSSFGKTIIVNTTNNVSTGAGETNLVQALGMLQDGDTINFNIPGTGPFYIATPPLTPNNGYPAITNNNVTIDGYSQTGSSPNSNTILSNNNARIQIVIDSRAGGTHMETIPGFVNKAGVADEGAAFFVIGASNFTVRGISFLGPGFGSKTSYDPEQLAVAFALGARAGHVNGCWIGLDPNGTDLFPFAIGVAAFQGPIGTFINDITLGVDKSASSVLIARSQFNIIVGEFISANIEGNGARISGNFFNVYPSGMADYNANDSDHPLESFVELGRVGENFLLGTDSDGHNDADERNVFGGVNSTAEDYFFECYTTNAMITNWVIAGNYFGVAIDGVTRFTNAFGVLQIIPKNCRARVGSDLDGFEDDIEANLFSNGYPFDSVYANPSGVGSVPLFCKPVVGSMFSFRGNRMVGNNIAPFSWAGKTSSASLLTRFTNVYSFYLLTNKGIIPTLSSNCTQTRLRGTCPLPRTPYTNVVIDVYLGDEEGWNNGQKFQFQDLAYTDPVTMQTAYYGFAQGKQYVGSFVENGPADLDPSAGSFDFDVSSLHLPAGAMVTVTANYSATAPGIAAAWAQTTVFANPVLPQIVPVLTLLPSGGTCELSWPTNAGLFTIQSSPSLPPSWSNLSPQPVISSSGSNYTAYVTTSAAQCYYRLAR